eukprot:1184430-Prorocentrum_minimum.AAC.2
MSISVAAPDRRARGVGGTGQGATTVRLGRAHPSIERARTIARLGATAASLRSTWPCSMNATCGPATLYPSDVNLRATNWALKDKTGTFAIRGDYEYFRFHCLPSLKPSLPGGWPRWRASIGRPRAQSARPVVQSAA